MSTRTRYLLDTNVISETWRKRPDEHVTAFLGSNSDSSLYLSVLTLGELRTGAAAKLRKDPDAARRISAWIDGLESNFADRILGIDIVVATLWGEWSAQRSRPVVDTLLAATAVVNDLTFVTRNTRDFRDIKLKLLNPWKN